jgi:hypothetical protein
MCRKFDLDILASLAFSVKLPVHLLLDYLLAAKPTLLQDLAIHFYLTYFLISEVEWWYQTHEYVRHPTISILQVSLDRIALATVFLSVLFLVVVRALGVKWTLGMVW